MGTMQREESRGRGNHGCVQGAVENVTWRQGRQARAAEATVECRPPARKQPASGCRGRRAAHRPLPWRNRQFPPAHALQHQRAHGFLAALRPRHSQPQGRLGARRRQNSSRGRATRLKIRRRRRLGPRWHCRAERPRARAPCSVVYSAPYRRLCLTLAARSPHECRAGPRPRCV